MGKVVVLYGKNKYTEMIRYVEEKEKDSNVLVILSDVPKHLNYGNKKWNYRSGLTSLDVERLDVTQRDCVVLEPYNVDDFNYYLENKKLLDKILKENGLTFYIIVDEDIEIKVNNVYIEKVTDKKDVNTSNGKVFHKTVLQHKKVIKGRK